MLPTIGTTLFAFLYLFFHSILVGLNKALWIKRMPSDTLPAVHHLLYAQSLSIIPFFTAVVTLVVLRATNDWVEALYIVQMVSYLEIIFIQVSQPLCPRRKNTPFPSQPAVSNTSGEPPQQGTVAMEPILRISPTSCVDLLLHFFMHLTFFCLVCIGGVLHYFERHHQGDVLYTSSLVGTIYACSWMVMDARHRHITTTLEKTVYPVRLICLFAVVLGLLSPIPFHIHLIVGLSLGLLATTAKCRQLLDRRQLSISLYHS